MTKREIKLIEDLINLRIGMSGLEIILIEHKDLEAIAQLKQALKLAGKKAKEIKEELFVK